MNLNHQPTPKPNKKTSKGWRLSGEYLAYRHEGGQLSPSAYNQILKELHRGKQRESN